MKKTTFLLSLFCVFYLIFQACGEKDTTIDVGKPNSEYISATDCTGSTPTYTADIKPILDTKCATSGCHAATNPAHGLNLSTYATTKADFNAHSFLCSINQDAATCAKMPQNGTKLAAADIKKITCWAKNNFPQ